ncbi:hypothetical protein N7457_006262 [Penicillium paradoxum]|uniref:uncharacterized protein n=1 Tax=Penicillium paradoxum TaxID=176176 RepID=UPI002548952E|nr:uncharacterized protein N7457_006262 [Penicillium paradoxum]KAJ5781102.1 hypothetical protein N7457_006262 [Penicillium paradoxum]
MPRKPTPAAKQRVRTGCLTCRKRRRKCDEQKPSCANCQVKGFACKYGSDLAFVAPRSGIVSGGKQGYSSITFVDDSPLAAASKSKAQQKSADESQSNAGFSLDGLQSADDQDNAGDTRRAFEFQSILSPTVPSVDFSEPPIPYVGGPSVPDTRYMSGAPYPAYRSVANDRTEKPALFTNGNLETDLLRHFRYHVGPWIDTGDPELPFGLQVLLLSRTNRALQAAVLALSAGQRLVVTSTNSQDLESSRQFRKEAEESLALEYDLARYAGHTLLMLQDVLPAGPQQWRNLLIHRIENVSDFASRAVGEEVGEALLWLYLRLDLASSISCSKPPLMPFRSLLRRDGTLLHHQTMRPQTVNSVYKHILSLLAHCLALVHGGPEMSSPHTSTSPDLGRFPSLRQSHSLSQWTYLWSDCQKWYNERPVNVQQIVDIRGSEADQIDPDHDSSFPILIYTTPMALVANAVYHIISLLLLTHKPRLLKSLPGPRSVTSHIWHAQSIAGIAASNDSPEQWDPILVASLLTIAKEMTHASQQTVLLERFARITATTGIKLDREIEALQSAWNLARYEEEFDDEADMIS